MKKIFVHGKKEFIGVCRNCGCKFSYELEDIVAKDYVTCPECDVRISHRIEPNDIFSDNDEKIAIPRGCEIRYEPNRTSLDAWENCFNIKTTAE